MPIFLDRHEIAGASAEDVAELHKKDIEVQASYGVRFLNYWYDHERGTAFCLIDAPDAETAMKVHEKAHGQIAADVIPVEPATVEAFLGRLSANQDEPSHDDAPQRALRIVMFTDIVDYTGMASRIGDYRAVEMVRAHDAILRRALNEFSGKEVKHTGDGLMSVFEDASAAVGAARRAQRGFAKFSSESTVPLKVRIGLHAGEPVEDSRDLFGTTVNIAARLCEVAEAEAILISDEVKALMPVPEGLNEVGERSFKGLLKPISVHEVVWRPSIEG